MPACPRPGTVDPLVASAAELDRLRHDNEQLRLIVRSLLISGMPLLTDQDRSRLFDWMRERFHLACGAADPRCQCDNDD